MWIRFKENTLINISKFDSITLLEMRDPRNELQGYEITGLKSKGNSYIIRTYENRRDAESDFQMIEDKLKGGF